MKRPVIMTVAGSDSGGGAGIQADLKTITVLGGFGISAITALTAQNGEGVRGIHAPEASFLRLQLETLLDGFPVAAAKTGMLFNDPIIETTADCLRNKAFPLVVDPVAVSQSGHKLLEDSAVQALIHRIIPLADVLTPNAPEAEALTGVRLRGVSDVGRAAGTLLNMGAKAVLLKGGHFHPADMPGGEEIIDWLCLPGQEPMPLLHQRVETTNNHGTGCTLSAALATFLGAGLELEDAVRRAQNYLVKALSLAWAPGAGSGPPDFDGGARLLKDDEAALHGA